VQLTKNAVSIKTALESTIKRLGISRQLKETNAVLVFHEVVGEEIAQRAKAVGIDNGRLFVQVSSPVWRQELTYQKEEIIAALNHKLGEEIVREIQFTG
jgi:predicted nucleic acid-binding Zn ribbon protein